MGTHPIFESDFDCLTEIDMASTEGLPRTVMLIEWPDHRNFFQRHKYKLLGTTIGAASLIALPHMALPLLGWSSYGIRAHSIASWLESFGYESTAWFRELQHLGSTHGPGFVGNSLFGSAGIFAGSSFVTYKELSPGRQKEYLKKLETPTNGIHIYPEYIYIKFNAFIHKSVPVAELKQA